MSEFARLNRGFVNWQGQRVFVPWFGAPRIVPSAVGETRILRLRFAMDYAPILVVVLFFAIAWWIDGLGRSVEEAVLALCLALFGLAVFLEQRWSSHWPQRSAAPFSRSRFMVGYYRSRSFGDRMLEFGWGAGGTILMFRYFDLEFWASLTPRSNWLEAVEALAIVGFMLFLLTRHTAVTLISRLPRRHRPTVEKSS